MYNWIIQFVIRIVEMVALLFDFFDRIEVTERKPILFKLVSDT